MTNTLPEWQWCGHTIASHSDLPENVTDFVYLITFTSGHKYIGKKTVRAMRRLPPKKAQLALRKNFVRRELVNVPFLKYQGSTEHALGLEVASRTILYLCSTKKSATYLETALLFRTDAVLRNDYVNRNISGRFFADDLDGIVDSDTSSWAVIDTWKCVNV